MQFGIRGRVCATLTDIRNGNQCVFDEKNIILNDFLNHWFTSATALFSPQTIYGCYVGTSDAPPRPDDEGLCGVVLAFNANGSDLAETPNVYTNYGESQPQYESYIPHIVYAKRWVFAAGMGTGFVKETAIRSQDGYWVARRPIIPHFYKSEYHVLTVDWYLYLTNHTLKSETFYAGMRGETIRFEFTQNDYQLYRLCTGEQGVWFGYTGTPVIVAGTSNSKEFPLNNGIQGEFIPCDQVAVSVEPYIANSLERRFVFHFSDTDLPEPVGEIVLQDFGRLTFDPPLVKSSNASLTLTITMSLVR